MKRSIIIILVVAIALVIGVSALVKFGYNNQSGEKVSDSARENNLNIKINNFAFSPKDLRIKVGETVLWTNQDSASHTVTSDSGEELESETLNNGEEYSHTFNTKGEYTYHCSFHTSMKGTIIVE